MYFRSRKEEAKKREPQRPPPERSQSNDSDGAASSGSTGDGNHCLRLEARLIWSATAPGTIRVMSGCDHVWLPKCT